MHLLLNICQQVRSSQSCLTCHVKMVHSVPPSPTCKAKVTIEHQKAVFHRPTRFRLGPKSTTLNDLERPFYVLCFKT